MRYFRWFLLFALIFVFKIIFLPFRLIGLFSRKQSGGGPVKLYRFEGDDKRYWETWRAGSAHTVHWGVLGERGETKSVTDAAELAAEMAAKRAEGYAEISSDEHYGLEVIFDVDGFGTPKDLKKRHALENRLNETLGWTGLGHTDGGSIGSDTMEVFVYVVDSAVAKQVIEADLRGSEFGDYRKIVIHAPFSEHSGEEP